ncbi:transmembrane protein 248 isoform X1 [Pygocentrus nattereri]|uniref:Zgc:158398 n=1 Tax=Pygocentrus nattereri TaxID=42514 RepID=A0A3B4E583_PYGNA|nr:transmembrane protein 248 isoform X1 [Pygocentrus nattereri]XP_017554895.1 transmembrane protein 248 isoform X1 [Pygocentrus nattereri]
MAHWKPVRNLKAKLLHHPPVVVFFLCLLALAGAFISIGIYSKNHDIKNPDISMDWNQMLGSLASLKFCTHLNSTEILSGEQDEDSPRLLDHGDGSITNTSQKTKGVVHVSLLVPLVLIGDEPNPNSISATLLGSQLGLKGAAGKELLNVSLVLHQQTPFSKTESNTAPDLKLPTNAETQPRSSLFCVRITAPAHLLPQTPKPPVCPANDNLEMSTVRALARESYKQSSHDAPCLSLEYTPDPKLTVLLTQEEKVLARYHLMLVSMVLLAICIIMCLTGTLVCSRSQWHRANDHFKKKTLLGA